MIINKLNYINTIPYHFEVYHKILKALMDI